MRKESKTTHKKQLLTKVMMKKRVQWATKYKNWNAEDWRKVDIILMAI